ncbi:MAG: hypothetical protein OXG72_13950 [Acidobacteria bacterium]|nr:hypothetical protein [Acidobacteriota bacterium]
MREVTCDPGRRRKTLLRAVARAGEFAWPRTAARFFRLYDELARAVRQAHSHAPDGGAASAWSGCHVEYRQ